MQTKDLIEALRKPGISAIPVANLMSQAADALEATLWRDDVENAPNREDVLLYQDGWAINSVIVGRRHGDIWLSDCFEINEPDQRPTRWKPLTPPEAE